MNECTHESWTCTGRSSPSMLEKQGRWVILKCDICGARAAVPCSAEDYLRAGPDLPEFAWNGRRPTPEEIADEVIDIVALPHKCGVVVLITDGEATEDMRNDPDLSGVVFLAFHGGNQRCPKCGDMIGLGEWRGSWMEFLDGYRSWKAQARAAERSGGHIQ